MSFDAWQDLGAKIGTYSSSTAWWLGDWLVFGRMNYGRRYKDAIAATGLDYQTLRNYAMVARRFEMSRRRDKLTFQHHAEVCALDDAMQDHWLELAEERRWTRNELRRNMRALAPARDEAPAGTVKLDIEPTRAERWTEAARRCDTHLGAWVIQVLDDAALAATEVD